MALPIVDMRCRLTTAEGAAYFHDRMSRLGRLDRVPALRADTEEAFFAEIGAAGVTTAVSVSGLNPGARLGRYELPPRTTPNDLLAEVQSRHPGRFVGVAGIDVSGTFTIRTPRSTAASARSACGRSASSPAARQDAGSTTARCTRSTSNARAWV